MRGTIFCTIVLSIILITSVCWGDDDFQYWSQYSLKLYDGEKIEWITFADVRFKENASKVGVFYVSERLKFDLWDNLSLGLNYTNLNSRSTSPGATAKDYKFQHRLEVEGNPHWKLGDWAKVHMRNRVEFRWIEDKGSYNTRYRQRWTMTFPLQQYGRLTAFYVSNEFFYNIAEHEHDENRAVPIGLNFKLTDKTSLKFYYMIQNRKGSDDWSANNILGSLVSLRF